MRVSSPTAVAPTLLIQIKTSMSNIIQCMVRLGVEYCQMEKFAMSNRRSIFATMTLTFLISTAAIAQQAQPSVPPPGSPAATITIPGDQLPAPPQKFGGKIEREATKSKPYWPARIVPPKGAPNVLLIITDDSGYGVPSTFGGVIPTPALDRIAHDGLRYTNFHSTALCSPTRAALITGRNHHSAGFGVIAEQATGYPGYDSVITKDKATIGRILTDNGYHTAWFGKNHNTPEYQASQAGPFDQWPTGMGFEYFYGFMARRHQPVGAGQPRPQHDADLSL